MPSENEPTLELFQDVECAALADLQNHQAGWHVLWTRSNFEKIVHDQLDSKNYEVYLPMLNHWQDRSKGSPVVNTPMFKGYLFVRHAMDKTAYLDISNTRGIVNILGPSWDHLAKVPDQEIQAIKQITESRMTVTPYPYLKVGTRVRIIKGVMQNAQGILVRSELAKGIFVISINLLQRSLAIKVDCSDVVPV